MFMMDDEDLSLDVDSSVEESTEEEVTAPPPLPSVEFRNVISYPDINHNGDITLFPDGRKIIIGSERNTLARIYSLVETIAQRSYLIYANDSVPQHLLAPLIDPTRNPVRSDLSPFVTWKDKENDRICLYLDMGACPEILTVTEMLDSPITVEAPSEECAGLVFTTSTGEAVIVSGHDDTISLMTLDLVEKKIKYKEIADLDPGRHVHPRTKGRIVPEIDMLEITPRGWNEPNAKDANYMDVDIAGTGHVYFLRDRKVFRYDPSENQWQRFAGSDGGTRQPASFGHPRALRFSRNSSIATDAEGNLLLLDEKSSKIYLVHHSGNFYNLIHASADRGAYRLARIRWSRSDPTTAYLIKNNAVCSFTIPESAFKRPKSQVVSAYDYLLQHPQFSDVVVKSQEGTEKRLHKFVLRCRAPNLLEMIDAGTVPAIPDEYLSMIIDYIYEGKMDHHHEKGSCMFWTELAKHAQDCGVKWLRKRALKAALMALWMSPISETVISDVQFMLETEVQKDAVKFEDEVMQIIASRPDILTETSLVGVLSKEPRYAVRIILTMVNRLIKNERETVPDPLWMVDDNYYLEESKRKGSNTPTSLVEALENSWYTDMTLAGIPCHRAILVPRCPFVSAAILSGFSESASGDIKLSDDSIPQQVVMKVLRYLYTLGDVAKIMGGKDPEECEAVLRLADFLQLQEHEPLMQWCSGILAEAEKAESEPAPKKQRK